MGGGGGGAGGRLDVRVWDGEAVVLDPPPVDCQPPPAHVEWLDAGGGVVAPRTADRHHITAANQLVLLGVSVRRHQNVVFHATVTNRFTLQTASGPLHVLRVLERE